MEVNNEHVVPVSVVNTLCLQWFGNFHKYAIITYGSDHMIYNFCTSTWVNVVTPINIFTMDRSVGVTQEHVLIIYFHTLMWVNLVTPNSIDYMCSYCMHILPCPALRKKFITSALPAH